MSGTQKILPRVRSPVSLFHRELSLNLRTLFLSSPLGATSPQSCPPHPSLALCPTRHHEGTAVIAARFSFGLLRRRVSVTAVAFVFHHKNNGWDNRLFRSETRSKLLRCSPFPLSPACLSLPHSHVHLSLKAFLSQHVSPPFFF